MAGVYYAAVEGDPLTSGEGSCVYSTKRVGTIADASGRPRRIAFIGDDAYCPKCKSTGSITYGVNIRKGGRMLDLVNGGRDQAVGGDIVLCKCPQHPRVVAHYARSCEYIDSGGNSFSTSWSPYATTRSANYDEQFTLRDGKGRALAETYYTVRMPDGRLIHGTTDSAGRTARHATDGAQNTAVYLGHRE